MQGINLNLQWIIRLVITIYECRFFVKAFSKVWLGSSKSSLIVVLWGKSQPSAALSVKLRDLLGYILIPCPQYGLNLLDWNYMHMSVTVHTTCLLSLPTSCWDADNHFWNIPLVLDVRNSIYIYMKDFSLFVVEGVNTSYANIFHTWTYISPREKLFWSIYVITYPIFINNFFFKWNV